VEYAQGKVPVGELRFGQGCIERAHGLAGFAHEIAKGIGRQRENAIGALQALPLFAILQLEHLIEAFELGAVVHHDDHLLHHTSATGDARKGEGHHPLATGGIVVAVGAQGVEAFDQSRTRRGGVEQEPQVAWELGWTALSQEAREGKTRERALAEQVAGRS
jgi:hypothetical protein